MSEREQRRISVRRAQLVMLGDPVDGEDETVTVRRAQLLAEVAELEAAAGPGFPAVRPSAPTSSGTGAASAGDDSTGAGGYEERKPYKDSD